MSMHVNLARFVTRLVPRAGPSHAAQSCHSWHIVSRAVASPVAALVTSDDVEVTVAAAVAAAGISEAGSAQQQLCQRLRDNWYYKAGDVAAMSMEEVRLLHIPVRLWATIKSMTCSQSGAASRPASDGLSDLTGIASVVITPATRPAASQALPPQQHAQQHQEGQAPQEVLPAGSSGPADAYGTAPSLSQPLPKDILQRRMPRSRTPAVTAQHVTVRLRQIPAHKEPYGLTDKDLTGQLQQEFTKLQQFSCGVFYGQRVPPLRPVSYTRYEDELRKFLGYAHHIRGISLDQLSLRTLLPSVGRESVSLLMDYQQWREVERGVAARSHLMPIKAAIALARYLYHDQSNVTAKPSYRDLGVVQELANMLRAAHKAADHAPLVCDESKKWLEWDEFLGLVQALRAECAGLTASGKPRARRDVAASLQCYLIVAILSVVPDRQRTLRELELGRTLLQQPDGTWVIKHGPGDYKTGKKYGDRPPLLIAPFIYPELEAFINKWQQELKPKTNKLFCKPKSRDPMDENAIYYLFKQAALRLTGKATHPHLVRDMIVTHLRMQQKSEAEMEALALYMGHSLAMQRDTYDGRTKAQKLRPAVELLQSLSRSRY